VTSAPRHPSDAPRPPAHLRTARFFLELCRFGARQLIRHRAPQMAAALAYRTIFSLIPLLVLALVVVKSVAGESNIRYGLRKAMEYTGISELELGPGPPQSDHPDSPPVPVPSDSLASPQHPAVATQAARLSDHIEEFVDRSVARLQSINFGVIAVVGALLLVYAAFSLLLQIEQSFNIVYRAPSGRRLIVRLVNYWALVTAGSLAIFFGFVLSDRSAELISSLPNSAPILWWIVHPLDLLLKISLTWLILMGAYRLMPNARVALGPAAVGALIAASLWELGKSALGRFVAGVTGPESTSQFAVYGSLALAPLFFLWIYVTWLIVLFGLEVAFALQMVRSGRAGALERLDARLLVDPSVAVILVSAVAERFALGKSSTIAELAERTGLAEATVERLLTHLVAKGLLLRVERSADDDAYSLARPCHSISAADVLAAMHSLVGGLAGPDNPDSRRDLSLLGALRQAELAALAPLNLDSLRSR